MKEFLIGFIVVAAIFSLCMLIAYLFCLVTEKSRKKIAPLKNDTKIYYITNIQQKKSKPKRSKEPSIALKGNIINQDELHKYFVNDEIKQGRLRK